MPLINLFASEDVRPITRLDWHGLLITRNVYASRRPGRGGDAPAAAITVEACSDSLMLLLPPAYHTVARWSHRRHVFALK